MRPEGWDLRLASAIDAARHHVWQWGKHDCASFAWVAASAAFGPDLPFAKYIGRHTTERGAARVLRHEGFADLAALMDAHAERIDRNFATRGDIAALRNEVGELALAVVAGRNIFVAAPIGLAVLPASLAETFWRIA